MTESLIIAFNGVADLVFGVLAATVNKNPRSIGKGNGAQVPIHDAGFFPGGR